MKLILTQEVDGLAALAHPVGLEQRAPVLQLAACLSLNLANVGSVSAWHGSGIGSV